MSKGSMENRVESLVNGEDLEAADLYDWEGNQVTDARVLRWPTREHRCQPDSCNDIR